MTGQMRGDGYTACALALDYAQAGFFEEALGLLAAAPQDDALVHYYAGWIQHQAGNDAAARTAFAQAAALPVDLCFPNTLESVLALQCAQSLIPGDRHAAYLLGNFWYAHRRYAEAIAAWEQAVALDGDRSPAQSPPAAENHSLAAAEDASAERDHSIAAAWRNLGLAYFNKRSDGARAWDAYERAHHLAPRDARIFFELDQLAKRTNQPPAQRLERLSARRDLVDARDDLTVEYLHLLLLAGRHAEALEMLAARTFHPWEGGEGKVTGAYVTCLVESARESLGRGDFAATVAALERALTYPHNLGEGRLPGALDRHVYYYLGLAYGGLGQEQRARDALELAASGAGELSTARYYNDQPPQLIFYQGLALRRLGREAEARAVFGRLVEYGQAHLDDEVTMDYFAVSLPDFLVFDEDLGRRNQAHCRYLAALGYLGLGEREAAREEFAALLALSADHEGKLIL